MRSDEIKNVSVMLNVNGQTLAVLLPAEMKLTVALFAVSAASEKGPAKLMPVPNVTLPADPEMFR